MHDDHFALDEGLRHLSKVLVGSETLETTLQRIVDVTERTLPTTTGVTVTVAGSHPRTAVATNDAVRTVDQLEYALGEGPSLTAMETSDTQLLVDCETEDRWPQFVHMARQEGIGSVLGVPLIAGDSVIGSLNIYAGQPQAFGDDHQLAAQLLAEQASVAMWNARTYDECGEKVRQLQEALETRIVIEQAKGVLMERERCGPEAAFEALKSASQRTNRKLRVIAGEIVESAKGT